MTAVAVTAMLLVRRRAPEGSYFQDGDRAAGVFGVLATGFSVLLGFIIFLSFQAYDDTRAGAETEATVVAQMVTTAQLMPGGSSQELTGELICYGRSVVGTEWDAVAAGRLQDSINPWGAAHVQHRRRAGADDQQRAVGLRPVDAAELGPPGGPQRARAHGGGHHPGAAVAGAVPHLRRHLRLHALLRRQQPRGP